MSRPSATNFLRLWLAAAAALAGLGLLNNASAAGPSLLTWSAPAPAGRHEPFSQVGTLTDLACPQAHLCLASDGDVWITRDPTAGAAGWSQIVLPEAVGRVSCTSHTTFCAAAADRTVYFSNDPAAGAPGWRAVRVPLTWTTAPLRGRTSGPTLHSLIGVSCPSLRLCVAFDDIEAAVTIDPSARQPRWRVVRLESGQPDPHDQPYEDRNRLGDLSCPTSALCVGVDLGGQVISTRHPAAGLRSWHRELIHLGSKLESISCPTTTLCLAADRQGNVIGSAQPAGPRRSWHTTHLTSAGGGLQRVSCPSPRRCVAVMFGAGAFTTARPLGPAAAWRRSPGSMGYASSCPTARLCVAVNGLAEVGVGSPRQAPAAWRAYGLDGSNGFSAVSCSSASFCLAMPGAPFPFLGGLFATSTDPAAGSWSTGAAPQVSALSCPAEPDCAAAGPDGSVLTSTHPARGDELPWSSRTVIPAADSCEPSDNNQPNCGTFAGTATSLSCPSASFCAVLGSNDSGDFIATSNDPFSAAANWTTTGVPASERISCSSATSCLAIEGSSVYFTSAPSGGLRDWTREDIDPSGSLEDVACSTAGCLAVDGGGRVLFSSTPSIATSWSASTVDEGHALQAVSCDPAGELCTAVDNAGNALTTRAPRSGVWASAHIDSASERITGRTLTGDLTAVSCPTASLCVAADGLGDLFTGTTN